MTKTILVTGGAGYIDSACVQAFLQGGHKVVVLDDLSTGQSEKVPAGAKFVAGDITDRAALLTVCQNYNFDTVVHCAAKKAVGESETNPSLYYYTNVLGSLNILSVMEDLKIPQIIFSSTAAVYQPPVASKPIIETDTVSPVNVYGRSKLLVEELINDYARLGKIKNFTIFRYFNVAGDAGLNYRELNAQNVFPLLARAVTTGDEFFVFGDDYSTPDGTGVRDYIHLLDLVKAHELALTKVESGIFNLGTGSGYSVNELVQAFAQQAGKTLNSKVVARRPGDPTLLVADATKAAQILGWQTKHSLKEMVESTLEAYK